MKGSYLLLLELDTTTVVKTRSRNFKVTKGFYVYVGSALSGLLQRVSRHERKEKKPFWHIDYLLAVSRLLLSVMVPSQERLESCLAACLSGDPVYGFGSSDSPLSSHLFFYSSFKKGVSDVFRCVRRCSSR